VMEDRLRELEPRLDRLGATQQDRLVETLGLRQATVEERLECPEELDVMRRRVVTVLECALHLLPRDLEIGVTAPEQCDRAAIHGQRERRRSEEHTSELQSRENLVCRLLLEKKKTK